LAKYKQILVNEPNNYVSLEKATILSCRIGARTVAVKDRRLVYESALAFAKRAFIVDSTNANSYYLLSLSSGRMTEVEDENKKKVAYVRDIKVYADKALQINPNHALANFIEGKWHYEMLTLNWSKKLAVKALYGGLPDPSIEKCIEYLEKCKKLDPYFVLNYLTLAKAYKEDNKAVKMLEVLNQLVKLPKRNFDDAAYIDEGKKMLADEQ
jgi:tetratricopeptide (TPR) repeat protein